MRQVKKKITTQDKERPTGFARARKTQGKLYSGLQIFELKQLADMEAHYKEQCRDALKAYKTWRRRHDAETDVIALLYGNLEGIMLRHQAEDAVQIYWTIRHDFRRGFRDYIDKCGCYPSTGRLQSKTA